MYPNPSNVVVFNYAQWVALFPELASINQAQATMYFGMAENLCDNSPCGIVPNCPPTYQRQTFLNLLTAHIASLFGSINGQPPNPLVGRISNATQGSVSVATQNDYPPGSAQYFQQTKYGAAYWQMSSQYRTMTYVPGPVPITSPYQWAYPNFFGNSGRS